MFHPSLPELKYRNCLLSKEAQLPGPRYGSGFNNRWQFAKPKGIAPAASILSVRVLNENGEGDSFTVARGIVEAVDRGAQVINMSLGGESSSSVLEQAVRYAHSHGVTVVAAVGNEGREGVAYPARYDGVVGVTSLDANSRVSDFANYGKGVGAGAPGVGVYSAWSEEETVSFSGTSTASAFVAGVLAAELSKKPGAPREQTVDLLYEYANESGKPGFDSFTGHGALSVARIENRFDPYGRCRHRRLLFRPA